MKTGKRTYRKVLAAPLALLLLSIATVTLLRWVPVGYTPVMLKRAFQFRSDVNYHSEREWVSLEDISPELIKAVIAAEDQRFYAHGGFDTREIRAMWGSHRRKGTPLRGCSTISQQTAKNVFTFGTRTVFRKVAEAWWTCLIERIWGKERILEVYLNVVEWGRGVYGAEKAAREYFGVGAGALTPEQASAMAVCLPRPLLERPDHLSPEGRVRYGKVLGQLHLVDYPNN